MPPLGDFMLIKIIIIILFGFILFSLGKALFFLRNDHSSIQMARALTWRIGLSVGVFVFILLAFGLGWIKPNGIGSATVNVHGGSHLARNE